MPEYYRVEVPLAAALCVGSFVVGYLLGRNMSRVEEDFKVGAEQDGAQPNQLQDTV